MATSIGKNVNQQQVKGKTTYNVPVVERRCSQTLGVASVLLSSVLIIWDGFLHLEPQQHGTGDIDEGHSYFGLSRLLEPKGPLKTRRERATISSRPRVVV